MKPTQQDEDYAMLSKNRYFDDPPIWIVLIFAVLAFSIMSGIGALIGMGFHALGWI